LRPDRIEARQFLAKDRHGSFYHKHLGVFKTALLSLVSRAKAFCVSRWE
jgi:hypothetical protein